MRSQDVTTMALDDQLAETFGLGISYRTQQVLVVRDGNHTVIVFACFLFGQANTAIFGIGKTSRWHNLVCKTAKGPQHRVLGGNLSFNACRWDQHALSIDIPCGKNMW